MYATEEKVEKEIHNNIETQKFINILLFIVIPPNFEKIHCKNVYICVVYFLQTMKKHYLSKNDKNDKNDKDNNYFLKSYKHNTK